MNESIERFAIDLRACRIDERASQRGTRGTAAG